MDSIDRWPKRLVVSTMLLVAVPLVAGAVAQSPSSPDWLRLRPLLVQLQADQAAQHEVPAAMVDSFLRPQGDDIDALVEIDLDHRAAALAWVEDYATRSTLIRADDLRALRMQLATLPRGAVERWWDSSAALRARLNDDEWLQSERWLAQFLAAQAIYTNAELNAFQSVLTHLSADELAVVVEHFLTVHAERKQRSLLSAQLRAEALRNNELLRMRPTALSLSGVGRGGGYAAPTIVQRDPRQPAYATRGRSLSQRVSQMYIYRSLYGANFIWWAW